jgi:hypothetical protein
VIEARSDRLIYFAANAMTREQYALPMSRSEPGMVKAGDEEDAELAR